MSRFILFFIFIAGVHAFRAQTDSLKKEIPEVHINAIRSHSHAQTSSSTIRPQSISHINLGQDIPTLFQILPSVNISSDAGNGVGYSYLYIRGMDAQRIQVNINGVPYNDAESQEVYWVNIPDIISSADNVQIQRGIGYSAIGGSGIGGTISIKTTKKYLHPFLQLNSSFGSFNTFKTSLQTSTGVLHNGWQVTSRGSWIQSDGYIDRAYAKLGSIYLDISQYRDQSSTHLIASHGREKTYQSWYGLSQDDYQKGLLTKNIAGTDYESKIGEPYDNQIDHYNQTHVQFIHNQIWNRHHQSSFTGFFTKGKGYYEEYKVDRDYSSYASSLSGSGDLTRQLWLNNYLYGCNGSHIIEKGKWTNTSAISYSQYLGYHFGTIRELFGSYVGQNPNEYYQNASKKIEYAAFNKLNYAIGKSNITLDLQLRRVHYEASGVLNSQTPFSFDKDFSFFNPKLGWNLKMNNMKLYSFLGMSHREPVRSDFLDEESAHQPLPERVYDLEIGLQKKERNYEWKANLFGMYFTDQLVPTGNVNSVGAPIRENVAKSYRAGVEIEFQYQINTKLSFMTNQYMAMNKIMDYTNYLITYNEDYSINESQSIKQFFSTTDIAFSPSWISFAELKWDVCPNTAIRLNNKTVSSQYLDNTSSESKSIPMYTIFNLSFSQKLALRSKKSIEFNLLLNNLLDNHVITRGYTYFSGNVLDNAGRMTKGQDYNYYFPQAGFHVLLGVMFGI